MENELLIYKTEVNDYKLSNPKILNLFISCLKSTHLKQEIKKKKDKRLMNLFSVRVNKYDDSSSHYKTDDKFKKRKADVAKNLNKKKRTYINKVKRVNYEKLTTKNSTKKFYSSAGVVEDSEKKFKIDRNLNNLNNLNFKKTNCEENEYDYENNSDSSIYTKEKFLHSNEEEYNFQQHHDRKPLSVVSKRKNIINEKFKYLKSKFHKQIDKTKARKNSDHLEKNEIINQNSKIKKNHENKFMKKNLNLIDIDTNLNSPFVKCIPYDNSLYNSYKSANSNERKTPSEHFLNYYLIKQIEDDKELIFYDGEDHNRFQYDDNYKCHYSLDHKSRIIYIKPSPKLLSSISSILNSKICSRNTTKNLSGDRSHISNGTPKKEGQDFDHNKIVEKLKNLELVRGQKEMENISRKIIYSSEGENESDRDN